MRLFLVLAPLLLTACSPGDDAAESAPPSATEVFAADHFLQFFNKQASLATGDYQFVAATAVAGQSGSYTLDILHDDGRAERVTGSWTSSGGSNPAAAGNPRHALRLERAGGVAATLSSSVDAVLVLVDHGGNVLAQNDNARAGSSDAAISLPRSRTNSLDYAKAYYTAIDPADARDTLPKWKTVNGFDAGEDTHVIFRDTRDLGYGRNMHFRRNADGSFAFYVDNYVVNDVPGTTYGPLNLDAAIAENRRYHIGTNAIEFGPVDSDNNGAPDDLNADGVVNSSDFFPRFYNFSPLPPFERKLVTDLDGKGDKAMPVPCITCHGGRADPLTPAGKFPRSGDTLAHLQPLDAATFEYSRLAPWTRAQVERGIRDINRAVYESYLPNLAPADGLWDSSLAREMLEAWYGGAGLPNAAQDNSYVPSGWQPDAVGSPPPGADRLYRNLVAENCRTCHLLRGINHQSDIDFTSYEKFIGHSERIQDLVFDQGLMPLALITFNNVRERSGLLEELASFLPGFTRALPDGSLPSVGLPVAKAGPDRRAPPGVVGSSDVPVTISGAASLFAERFEWRIEPEAACPASLRDARSVRPTVVATAEGVCQIVLTVSNALGSSTDRMSLRLDAAVNPAPRAISFETHIRPVLQNGTDSCAVQCHSRTPVTRVVPPVFYTNPAAGEDRNLYEDVVSRVDFRDPENSRILSKPMGQHHNGLQRPGFDPGGDRANYDLFLDWILEGARKN